MKAAGICRRSLSSGFSRFRRSFGADSDFDSVKRYILGQGTEEIKEIKEMSLQRTINGICSYMETSLVKQQQFTNIGSLLSRHFEKKLGEGDLEGVESYKLLGIFEDWDEYVHRNYFKLPAITSSMCVLMRLEGLVNSVLLLELKELFGETAVKDNLPQVFETRRYKSKGVALFVENISQGSRSLSGSKYSSEIRALLQKTESKARR